jgi:hypothetical protein
MVIFSIIHFAMPVIQTVEYAKLVLAASLAIILILLLDITSTEVSALLVILEAALFVIIMIAVFNAQ